MAYSIPAYIIAAGLDDPVLSFRWDDWRASEDFKFDPTELLETLSGATTRARVAAAIGIYEWILWRFHPVSEDPIPLQIAEAAWCANVHRSYMDYTELPRREWLGPVRGPLWGAMTWLIDAVLLEDDKGMETESGLAYLSRLAVHVLPAPRVFLEWLQPCAVRLAAAFPAAPDNPFEDLFGERAEQRRGPWVPREALTPGCDPSALDAAAAIDRFLANVVTGANPFLRTPDDQVRAEG